MLELYNFNGYNQCMIKPMQQTDPAIKDLQYGDGTIGNSGCALLACVNAYLTMTGKLLDVKELINLSHKNDCFINQVGTKWTFLFLFAKHYGLDIEITHDIRRALDVANPKSPVIVSAHNRNKQILTLSGHWIALIGKKDNNFLVQTSSFYGKAYNSPGYQQAMKDGLLTKDDERMLLWMNTDLLASEVKHEFPEQLADRERFINSEFGGAILRRKATILYLYKSIFKRKSA